MKIKELWFKNNRYKWELEKTAFSDLTLLVGASGVGKTQILNAIMKLINISNGYAYNGIEWDFRFTADSGEDYRWTGEFESIEEIEQQEFKGIDTSGSGRLWQIPRMLNEKLYMEDKLVFEREESKVKYELKDVPRISLHRSVLSLFTEEDEIFNIKFDIDKIVFFDYALEKLAPIVKDTLENMPGHMRKGSRVLKKLLKKKSKELNKSIPKEDLIEKFVSLEVIGIIDIPNIVKIAFTYFHLKEYFEQIVCDFKDIFPQVEDVRFELLKKQDVYELQIKERGTDWISRSEISSGMFKTLMHIAEMKLLTDGSVVLIDEFENSLGVNCIDTVAGGLVNPDRDLQYIITSHHPYIINNIDMKYWKVVMRKGAKVFTKNAEQLKLGKSKHEAFKQLLNLEEFAEGIS